MLDVRVHVVDANFSFSSLQTFLWTMRWMGKMLNDGGTAEINYLPPPLPPFPSFFFSKRCRPKNNTSKDRTQFPFFSPSFSSPFPVVGVYRLGAGRIRANR